MSNVDDLLGTLPGRQTLHIDHAVLGNDVMDTGTGISGNGTGSQSGNNAAL